MNKHTPEPWSINEWTQPDNSIAIGAVGTPLIARVVLRDVSINEHKANAARIIACVNACGAMDDPTTEIRALKAQNLELNAQCDELLEALQLFVTDFENYMDDEETDSANVYEKAKAAIAKMEGGES